MEPFLETISTIIPNEKIDRELNFPTPNRGPQSLLKPSQNYRIHLLLCLKRIASFRQLQADLFHNRDWRSFSFLKNKNQVPSLDVLSRFRQQGSDLLRQINQLYLQMIFSITGIPSVIVAVPDSTDIRAATKGYPKKNAPAPLPVNILKFIRQHMRLLDIEPKNQDSPNGLLVTRNIHFAFFS